MDGQTISRISYSGCANNLSDLSLYMCKQSLADLSLWMCRPPRPRNEVSEPSRVDPPKAFEDPAGSLRFRAGDTLPQTVSTLLLSSASMSCAVMDMRRYGIDRNRPQLDSDTSDKQPAAGIYIHEDTSPKTNQRLVGDRATPGALKQKQKRCQEKRSRHHRNDVMPPPGVLS